MRNARATASLAVALVGLAQAAIAATYAIRLSPPKGPPEAAAIAIATIGAALQLLPAAGVAFWTARLPWSPRRLVVWRLWLGVALPGLALGAAVVAFVSPL